MQLRSICGFLLLLTACAQSPGPTSAPPHPQQHTAASAPAPQARAAFDRPLELRRHRWSRLASTDSAGFYAQPAALCEDYPEESTTMKRVLQDFAIVRETGAAALRFAFGWDGIETEPGKYNWGFWDEFVETAHQQGVELIPYVCYTPRWAGRDPNDYWREPPSDLAAFGRFMHQIVSRYKHRIHSWELWNEPDLEAYWLGTADQFALMIEQGARQVRAADPSAIVVLGGMARGRGPFFDRLIRDHHLDSIVDVVNLHGYLETWSEERAETWPERISSFVSLLPVQRSQRPDLWVAEFGYSSHRHKPDKASAWGIDILHRHEHTPAFQAIALLRHHALVLASGQASLTAWYRIRDLPAGEKVIGDDNNRYLGLLDPRGQKKPAYSAMRQATRLFGGPLRPWSGNGLMLLKGDKTAAFAFERKTGEVVIAAWVRSATRQEVADRSGQARDDRSDTLTLRINRHAFSAMRVEEPGGPEPAAANALPAAEHNGSAEVSVALSGKSVFLAELLKSGP